ncbi:MAG: hypothetical protein R2832_03750 [Rhodothermales bacterium]
MSNVENAFQSMRDAGVRTVCVQWACFGPYHLARLEAAGQLFSSYGIELVGLETYANQEEYDWTRADGSQSFRRETLFDDELAVSSGSPRAVESRVFHSLAKLRPDAVAITSYSTPDARSALRWCLRNNVPAILMTESHRADADRVGWRESIKRLIVAQFGSALVGGTPQREYLAELGFDQARTVRGFDVVDNEFFARAAAEYEARGGARSGFVCVSRFIARKNLFRLVEAYSVYRGLVDSPWSLTIVGGGALRPDVEKEVTSWDWKRLCSRES